MPNRPPKTIDLTCPSCGFQWFAHDPIKRVEPVVYCPRCKNQITIHRDQKDAPRLWIPQ